MQSLLPSQLSPSARSTNHGNGDPRRVTPLAFSTLSCFAVALLLLSGGIAAGQESSREAALFFSDVVNFQNAGEFDLAADEWKKFIEKFPQDPLAAKAQNYLAVCQLQLKKYPDSVANFETVLKKYPQADFREEALLNLASANYAWAQDGNPAKFAEAANRFSALLKEFPKTEFADQAQYFLAESLYRSGKKEVAIAAYGELAQKYPQSALAADAIYAMGVTQEELQQHPQAQKTYDQFLSAYPKNPLVTEVTMRKGETLLQQKQFDAAEKLFEQAAKTKDFELADHAWYRLAFCALQGDDLMQAGNAYARIPLDFPKSSYAAESTMLAGRCYYRAGKLDDAARWLVAAGKLGGKYEVEAGHWLARVYLQQDKPAEAETLVKTLLPKVQGGEFLVDLKMDQADAVYEQAARRKESIGLYKQIAEQHAESPEAPRALYNAAFAALEIRDFTQAAALADQFAQKFPQDESKLDAMYVGAEAKLQTDQLTAAEKDLKSLLQEGKDRTERPRWQLRLALTQYLQEKYAEAAQTVTAVKGNLTDPELLAQADYLLGASAFQQNQFDQARQALEASVKASTQWPQADEARLMLARTLQSLGQTAAAIEQAQAAIKAYPQSQILDQVQFRLGEFLFAAERFADSAGAYQTVVSQWPKSPLVPHSLYGAGWAYLKLPDVAKAEAAFSKLITDHGQHELVAQAHTGRALARRQAGKFAEAIADLDAVIAKSGDPGEKLEAQYLKGVSLVDSNRPADAEKVFATLQQQHPDFANADKVLYELAWAQRSQEKQDAAVAHFRQLAEKHPDSPLAAEAMYHVGEAAYAKGDYAEAETWYTSSASTAKALEIGEKALYKQAWSQYQQGKTDKALEGFGKQISQYPNGPLASDAIFMQGECFFKDKEFDAALDSYQRVDPARLSSDEMRSLLLLHAGQSASQQKLWNEAKKWYTQLVETLPQSPLLGEAYYELGWASYNERQTPQAIESFQLAADTSRGLAGARARFMLGEIYFEQKNYEDAIRQFKLVVYGFGGEQSLASVKPWQAKCAYEIGRCSEVQIREAPPAERGTHLEEARKVYSLVVERYAQSPEAKLAQTRLEALAKL